MSLRSNLICFYMYTDGTKVWNLSNYPMFGWLFNKKVLGFEKMEFIRFDLVLPLMCILRLIPGLK